MTDEPTRDYSEWPCEDKFGALDMVTMQFETTVLGYGKMLKAMLESQTRPSDEKIIKLLERMIVAAHTQRNFRESLREQKKPE